MGVESVVGPIIGVGVDAAIVAGAPVGSDDGVGEGIKVKTTSLEGVGATVVGTWAASLPQPLLKSAARSSKPTAARCCNFCR
jgi:hypothetical protein